jgi:predicted MFS family arabinose efflux permease
MSSLCLGFMGFMSASFWLSLYLQEVKHSSAIEIAAQLLPMVINGTLVNVVCGLILHKVSNKLLMQIATVSYTAAFLILSFMKEDSSYWAFIFPALVLVVVGADIEFNVANVRKPCLGDSFLF